MRPCDLRRHRAASLMFVGLVAVASCTDAMLDPDPPGTIKPTGELTIIRLPADAPPLFNDSVAFYARPGRDAEGFIYFQEDDGSRGEKFVELKIKQGSLAAFPDGRPFGPNDSVRIVIRVRDARTLIVDLEPAGLSFNRAEPAELKIEYEETGGDLDDDGDDDEDDDEIEQLIAIWRQENPTDPFVKLGTVKTEGLRELEAELLGFSRFAVAY